ncbi:MAG TPA: hypothetical protein VKV05_10635 [Terriglobales bacterium]|nr:hypothetical protein [Terriglobales bacterium]
MDEGRRRVLLSPQLFSLLGSWRTGTVARRQHSSWQSAMRIATAERIMPRIDARWPAKTQVYDGR